MERESTCPTSLLNILFFFLFFSPPPRQGETREALACYPWKVQNFSVWGKAVDFDTGVKRHTLKGKSLQEDPGERPAHRMEGKLVRLTELET